MTMNNFPILTTYQHILNELQVLQFLHSYSGPTWSNVNMYWKFDSVIPRMPVA